MRVWRRNSLWINNVLGVVTNKALLIHPSALYPYDPCILTVALVLQFFQVIWGAVDWLCQANPSLITFLLQNPITDLFLHFIWNIMFPALLWRILSLLACRENLKKKKKKVCILDKHLGTATNAKKSPQEFKQVFQSSSLVNYLSPGSVGFFLQA